MTVDVHPIPAERLRVRPANDPEADWARAACAGDRLAFARLHERFVRLVHGIVLSRVGARHVDDLVQDVFATALERIGSLRDPAAFGAWIASIARSRATDFHRRAAPRAHAELPDDEALRAAGVPAHVRAEALEALSAIRALPEAYRETLVLRLVEGLTGPEIAARTGLTPGSVRVNLHRGMRLLRKRLGGEETS